MKKPEPIIVMLTLRQYAQMIYASQGRLIGSIKDFISPEKLSPDVEKQVAVCEKKLRLAVQKKKIKVIADYKDDGIVLDVNVLYDWAKENGYSLNQFNKEKFKRKLSELEEKFKLWDFQHREGNKCTRKVNEKQLEEFVDDPLWELNEGLMLLDGFEPYRDYDVDKKYVQSDERLSRLYRQTIDACKAEELNNLMEKHYISQKFGIYEYCYAFKPQKLIGWLLKRNEKLQMLSKLNKKMKIKKTESEKVNHNAKSSYLKIIYALVKKYYNYDPASTRNTATATIRSRVQTEKLKITDKTVKGILDEAYKYCEEIIKS